MTIVPVTDSSLPQPSREENNMLLHGKTAIVYGAGGAIGSAVARAFGAEGARVFATGRTLAPVEAVANEIVAARGSADPAQVDALDEEAVNRHAARVAEQTGGIDVSFNAVGVHAVQGTPLTEFALTDFALPITTWPSIQLLSDRQPHRRHERG